MAYDVKKNPLLGDKTGLSEYKLLMELNGIFARTMGPVVAMKLLNGICTYIEMVRRTIDKTPGMVIIDRYGFWRGMVDDVPEMRTQFKKIGFEIYPCPRDGSYTVATKQWVKKRKAVRA